MARSKTRPQPAAALPTTDGVHYIKSTKDYLVVVGGQPAGSFERHEQAESAYLQMGLAHADLAGRQGQ